MWSQHTTTVMVSRQTLELCPNCPAWKLMMCEYNEACLYIYYFQGAKNLYPRKQGKGFTPSVWLSVNISCKPNSSLTDLYNLKICMKEDNPCWKLSRDIIICARQSVSFVLWLTVLVSSNTKSENVNVLFKVKSTHFTLTTSLPE